MTNYYEQFYTKKSLAQMNNFLERIQYVIFEYEGGRKHRKKISKMTEEHILDLPAKASS